MEQRSLASAACPARSWAWALLGIQEQWELPVWSPEEWKREKVCVRAGDTPPPEPLRAFQGTMGYWQDPNKPELQGCVVWLSVLLWPKKP